MPVPTFPAGLLPDYGVRERPTQPRVLISTHMDGTEQRKNVGGGRRTIFELHFGGLTNSELTSLTNHYQNQHGEADAFEWHHPDRPLITYTVRYDGELEIDHAAYDHYDVRVRFQVLSFVVEEAP